MVFQQPWRCLIASEKFFPINHISIDRLSEEKEADFFKKFDVVIATTCSQAELVRINSICRAANILFYAGDVFGFFGFSFMDLVSHNFVEEVTTQVFLDPIQGWATERHFLTFDLWKVQSGADDGEPAAKKQKTIESETKSVKKEMAFVSLAETLKVRYCVK